MSDESSPAKDSGSSASFESLSPHQLSRLSVLSLNLAEQHHQAAQTAHTMARAALLERLRRMADPTDAHHINLLGAHMRERSSRGMDPLEALREAADKGRLHFQATYSSVSARPSLRQACDQLLRELSAHQEASSLEDHAASPAVETSPRKAPKV